MQINEKINQLMAKHGTNPTQLAKQLGLSQPSVFGWCQGKTAPSKKNIIKRFIFFIYVILLTNS